MSSPGFQKSKRTWQEIAAEAFVEKDPAKLERLADELVQALDERDKILCQKSAWTNTFGAATPIPNYESSRY
jgi:hypothetical protein